jgi:hypothetical protein
MAEPPKGAAAIGKFIESPFLWAGVSGVVGCALGSARIYIYAFWFCGFLVAFGVFRARPFRDKINWIQFGTTSFFCAFVFLLWFFLWHIIPRPTEPPTKEAIADAVFNKWQQTTPVSPSLPSFPLNLPTTMPKPPVSKPASADQIADAIVARLPKPPELSNSLLVTSVNEVLKRLADWHDESRQKDIDLHERRDYAQTRLQNLKASAEEQRTAYADWTNKIGEARDESQRKLTAIMADADSLRQLMLQRIPQAKWTADDRDMNTNNMFKNSSDVTGKICTRWNERESTWRKSGLCQSRGTSQSKS